MFLLQQGEIYESISLLFLEFKFCYMLLKCNELFENLPFSKLNAPTIMTYSLNRLP